MYIKYFADANNRDLVDAIAIEMDTSRIQSLLLALPIAMHALLDTMPRLPSSENDDFEAHELHRKHLNSVIVLAEQLMELFDVLIEHKTFLTSFDLQEPIQNARTAFQRLQAVKTARIAITHSDLGEHFGSATAFQTFSYLTYVEKIDTWIEEKSKL